MAALHGIGASRHQSTTVQKVPPRPRQGEMAEGVRVNPAAMPGRNGGHLPVPPRHRLGRRGLAAGASNGRWWRRGATFFGPRTRCTRTSMRTTPSTTTDPPPEGLGTRSENSGQHNPPPQHGPQGGSVQASAAARMRTCRPSKTDAEEAVTHVDPRCLSSNRHGHPLPAQGEQSAPPTAAMPDNDSARWALAGHARSLTEISVSGAPLGVQENLGHRRHVTCIL